MNFSPASAPERTVLEGVRVDAGQAARARIGEVAYTVVDPGAATGRGGEQRAGQRRRTRLRSGKLADARRRFIIECIFHDRSVGGARLRLVKNVALPEPLLVYDDETGTLSGARVVWRDRQDVGIRFAPRLDEPACRASTLGAKFYALPRTR